MIRWDRSIRLLVSMPGARMSVIGRILGDGINKQTYLNEGIMLAKRAIAHYWQTRVKPYLILPGPIEIDETKVGQEKGFQWGNYGKHPIFKVSY